MFLIEKSSLGPDGLSELEGAAYEAGSSLIFVDIDREGEGPALHQHPYSETFVILGGAALFTVGTESLTGRAGQIIVVPRLTPHKFEKTGSETLEMIDVHASGTIITEWL